MHSPDSVLTLPKTISVIGLASHTLCGQLRLTGLYKKALPVLGPFDRGHLQVGANLVYMTCGVGEIGLPIRFINPPAIDVIEFKPHGPKL
jgi:uncharacterized protein